MLKWVNHCFGPEDSDELLSLIGAGPAGVSSATVCAPCGVLGAAQSTDRMPYFCISYWVRRRLALPTQNHRQSGWNAEAFCKLATTADIRWAFCTAGLAALELFLWTSKRNRTTVTRVKNWT